MAWAILQELETFGPHKCERLSHEQAAAYTRRLARSHYENFSVVSFLVPRRLRDDFANVYAFCRWADDLGDETGDAVRSLDLLSWWKGELEACYADDPRHPVFVALHKTIRSHDIPIRPFADLIDAFVQDQRVTRYETWDQVLDYCTRSADPVGRLVLYLCGYRDERRQLYSDRTCTALQLVNFWQDVRRDIVERDRMYLPAQDLARHGLTHDGIVAYVRGPARLSAAQQQAYRALMAELLDRTQPLFEEGRQLWPLVAAEVRLPIQLFTLGGEAVVRGIRRIDYDTLDRRPSIGKATKLCLMARALWGKLTGARA
jgi:squalene synthase HpnC